MTENGHTGELRRMAWSGECYPVEPSRHSVFIAPDEVSFMAFTRPATPQWSASTPYAFDVEERKRLGGRAWLVCVVMFALGCGTAPTASPPVAQRRGQVDAHPPRGDVTTKLSGPLEWTWVQSAKTWLPLPAEQLRRLERDTTRSAKLDGRLRLGVPVALEIATCARPWRYAD